MLDEHKALWLGKESDARRAPLELVMQLCLLCLKVACKRLERDSLQRPAETV